MKKEQEHNIKNKNMERNSMSQKGRTARIAIGCLVIVLLCGILFACSNDDVNKEEGKLTADDVV